MGRPLPSTVASCSVGMRPKSPGRLARLTKRIFDLTPSQFITKVRIASASRVLLDTDNHVAEVAYVVGYYDHSAFTRAFRTATGVSPTEFRAACRAQV